MRDYGGNWGWLRFGASATVIGFVLAAGAAQAQTAPAATPAPAQTPAPAAKGDTTPTAPGTVQDVVVTGFQKQPRQSDRA